eukprot:jgi/Mesen1/5865/ME000298S05137
MAQQTTPEVTLETTMGPVTVELYQKQAPKACRNFLELARRDYYNGTKFHRVIKDFMIQGGDPTGTGRGGESIYGGGFWRAGKHTVFGRVSRGMEVVKRLGNVQTDRSDRPVQDVKILKTTVHDLD